ncbi:MAG TPA: methyltransferase [Clostridiales bacterium]|jgi:uroporphyrinogen decarboxylase|nr:methyltransferase [Clostridiales bacterium]
MTSRERIIEAISHREPDVLPVDFGGMRSTGISARAYKNLKDYLGIKEGTVKLYDVFQQLAEPEMEVLNLLGGDVVQLHRLAPAFDIKIDRWKQVRLYDEFVATVPEDYSPLPNENGDLEIRDKGTVIARMPKGGFYFDQVIHPYEKVETYQDIDNIAIPEITDEELAFLEKEARKLYEQTDKAILAAFGGNIFEAGQINWGYEKFYVDLAINKDLVHYWLNKLTDAYLRDLDKYLKAVGKYINVIQFGDDLGTQQAPQISTDMYREMIKPYHQRQYEFVRNNYPHIKVFLHSCGAIYDLIPDLIDAGVEILNPVQISAKGMDPLQLKKEYGNDLVFWGGGADMQGLVNFGSIDQIKQHTRELIEIFSPGGGYVFNQVHNIQSNITPEKIMAIYKTALSFRKNG